MHCVRQRRMNALSLGKFGMGAVFLLMGTSVGFASEVQDLSPRIAAILLRGNGICLENSAVVRGSAGLAIQAQDPATWGEFDESGSHTLIWSEPDGQVFLSERQQHAVRLGYVVPTDRSCDNVEVEPRTTVLRVELDPAARVRWVRSWGAVCYPGWNMNVGILWHRQSYDRFSVSQGGESAELWSSGWQTRDFRSLADCQDAAHSQSR
jgi:hypothetical protein